MQNDIKAGTSFAAASSAIIQKRQPHRETHKRERRDIDRRGIRGCRRWSGVTLPCPLPGEPSR